MTDKEFMGVTQRPFQSHNKTSTKVQGVIPQLSQQKTKDRVGLIMKTCVIVTLEWGALP